MRVVVQRVAKAQVSIDEQVVSKIRQGFLLLVGIAPDDGEEQLDYLVRKITNLRVFSDAAGKMNASLADINGEILSISQFTLYADTKKKGIDRASPERRNRKLRRHYTMNSIVG